MVKLEMEGIDQRVFGSEEAVARAIVELVNVDKAFQLSDLDENEAKQIAFLTYMADLLGSKRLENFINKYLMLKVSVKRKGRQEITLIAARAGEYEPLRIKSTKGILPGFG